LFSLAQLIIAIAAVAFVYSPNPQLLPPHRRNSTSGGLMHASDWAPTLLTLAGASTAPLPTETTAMDGVDAWPHILSGSAKDSARTEIVHKVGKLTEIGVIGAFRQGDFKLYIGDPGGAATDGWIPCPTSKGVGGGGGSSPSGGQLRSGGSSPSGGQLRSGDRDWNACLKALNASRCGRFRKAKPQKCHTCAKHMPAAQKAACFPAYDARVKAWCGEAPPPGPGPAPGPRPAPPGPAPAPGPRPAPPGPAPAPPNGTAPCEARPCLFDLAADPNEHVDLNTAGTANATRYAAKVKSMAARFLELSLSKVDMGFGPHANDASCAAAQKAGAWAPWVPDQEEL